MFNDCNADVELQAIPLEFLINKCGCYFKELKRHNTTGAWEVTGVFFPDRYTRYKMRDYRVTYIADTPQQAVIMLLKTMKEKGIL